MNRWLSYLPFTYLCLMVTALSAEQIQIIDKAQQLPSQQPSLSLQKAVQLQTTAQESSALQIPPDPQTSTMPLHTYKPDSATPAAGDDAPTRNYPATSTSDANRSANPDEMQAPNRNYYSSTSNLDELNKTGPYKGYITTQASDAESSNAPLDGVTPTKNYPLSTSNPQIASPAPATNYDSSTSNLAAVQGGPTRPYGVPLGATFSGYSVPRNYVPSTSSALKDFSPPLTRNGAPPQAGIRSRESRMDSSYPDN